MRLGPSARPCLLLLHAPISRTSRAHCPSSLRKHTRKFSQVLEGSSSHSPRSSSSSHSSYSTSPIIPVNLEAEDVIVHLRKIFPPLEFPEDVAQRMTTHVSWERGVKGHNGRLGFVGRRVLHTYLLLFLQECSLATATIFPSKSAHLPPASRIRPSFLKSEGTIGFNVSYDDISAKILNTYVLGEHVGGAWELERIMRWTPAIAELDTLRAQLPDKVLHSSGLYKVRGATVEGVMGGIFHQFGGVVAHRVFHTRVLPHIYQHGLPESLHAKMREACKRLGGQHGNVMPVKSSREQDRPRAQTSVSEQLAVRENGLSATAVGASVEGQQRRRTSIRQDTDEYIKLGEEQRIKERRRLGYVG